MSATNQSTLAPFSRVMVAGGGVLGRQIAFQTAFHGFEVALYEPDAVARAALKTHFLGLQREHQHDLDSSQAELDAALDRIHCHAELAAAVDGVQLVIEAVPENVEIKTDFYRQLDRLAAPETIFASNSSTLVPTQMAQATGRPARYLHLHFANRIWKYNTAEVMRHPQTDPAVFDAVVAFAGRIGMVVLPMHKEHPGYILNALLIPMLNAALELVVEGIADIHAVDKTWMIARESPIGPFGMFDRIGLNTLYQLQKNRHAQAPGEHTARVLEFLDKNYLAQGKLGKSSGEGFYAYPDPAYARADFIAA